MIRIRPVFKVVVYKEMPQNLSHGIKNLLVFNPHTFLYRDPPSIPVSAKDIKGLMQKYMTRKIEAKTSKNITNDTGKISF